jgi:hypothetical protein
MTNRFNRTTEVKTVKVQDQSVMYHAVDEIGSPDNRGKNGSEQLQKPLNITSSGEGTSVPLQAIINNM